MACSKVFKSERGQNQNWLPQPCLIRARKRAESLPRPCILGGTQQRGQNKSGPKRGRKCYITPAFSGVPNAKRGDKIRSGYLTPAVSGVPNKGDKIKVGPEEGGNATSPLHSRGSPTPSAGTKSTWAQKRAEMLHHPCILGGPQTNGDKIRIGCLNPAFWGTHKWAEMLRQPCFLRDTQQRGQKQSTKKTKKTKTKNFPWCP